jgi:hypothetical protein
MVENLKISISQLYFQNRFMILFPITVKSNLTTTFLLTFLFFENIPVNETKRPWLCMKS